MTPEPSDMQAAMERVIALLTAQQAEDGPLVVHLVGEATSLTEEERFNVVLAMTRISGVLMKAAAENANVSETEFLRMLALGIQSDPPPDSRRA